MFSQIENNGTYSLTLLYHTKVDTYFTHGLFCRDEDVHSMASYIVYLF
jgi:hypothetical protein